MRKSLAILLVTCLLTGCAYGTQLFGRNEEANTGGENVTLEEDTEVGYFVPESKPHIMINQEGYDNKGRKTVIFCGEELPQTFEVIDKSTGMPVYNGKIKLAIREASQKEAIGYAYFTELEQSGNYYIRADIIGQSYPFDIEEGAKEALFLEISKNCYQKWEKSQGGKQEFVDLLAVLTAFELYKEVFLDDLGVSKSNNGIPDILDGMKTSVDYYVVKTAQEYDSMEDILLAAGILAKFSSSYKEYDKNYAQQCSKSAETLWNYTKNVLSQYPATYYFAAAELYKNTGREEYNNVIKKYQSNDETLDDKQMRLKNYGDIAYLSTRRKVNLDLCDKIMKDIMERVGDQYAQNKMGIPLVLADSTDEMLEQVLQMGIVAYVVTSHEYSNVIENQMNYFLGCNETGTNYKEELSANSEFLFMMSAIVKNEKALEE